MKIQIPVNKINIIQNDMTEFIQRRMVPDGHFARQTMYEEI